MKLNYLNNKDILKEIHKSKTSYCTYTKPEYADYDIIVTDFKYINKKNTIQARKNRAERLAKESLGKALETFVPGQDKPKLENFLVKHTKIPDTDVIFRVMTWDHVSKYIVTKPTLVEDDDEAHTEYDDEIDYKFVKVNFPPFQHWKLNESGEPYCVGKSHWKGDLEKGEFSKDHGKMTNKLALMFMKLCERYGTRSNWRSYTYNDEMRSQALLQLSQIGLQFDESKSSNPFAYYTAVISNSFTRVLNIEKRNQNIRDDILEQNNMNPSYTRQFSNQTPHED
jgi:hypothetical protein